MLTLLAECPSTVPINCINPRADFSTAGHPTVALWVAALILVLGFALAGVLILVRSRM